MESQTMPVEPLTEIEEKLIEYLAAKCDEHTRCPTNHELSLKGFVPDLIQRLALSGHLKVEVYAPNFRVVHILAGNHQGKQTALPEDLPPGTKPKRVLDIDGYSDEIKRFRSRAPITLEQPPWDR